MQKPGGGELWSFHRRNRRKKPQFLKIELSIIILLWSFDTPAAPVSGDERMKREKGRKMQ